MHRTPFKVALFAALLAGGFGAAIAAVAPVSFLYPVLSTAAVGLGVYLIVRQLITDPLRRVDEVLSGLREEGGRREAPEPERDEIGRLVRKADQARIAVERRMTDLSRAENYRREYVGDVSHEIKTPIFAIQGFAETLLAGALEDRSVNRGFVEKILHHAARLNALATDLAEISRLEAGTLNLSRTLVASRKLFEEVGESLEHALQEKGVRLDVDVAADAAWVDGDRDRLRQVVTNLADNALKYNRSGGHVRLSARREGAFVRWAVEDDGIGIAPEDLKRVTDRFYRADKSRTRAQGGTGLGLSIVKHILAAHGAPLDISSTPDVGSTFAFTLPAAEGPPAGQGTPQPMHG
jgi:two-component system phosphate regulon sensor histidine kinase PhoR